MGTQTSRATYSRLLVNSFIFGYSFHSVNLILQAVHPLITFDGGGGKTVVLPPCGQRSTDGKPSRDHLLKLGIVDGQQRLTRCAEQLICQGEAQHSSAGQSTGGDFLFHVSPCLSRASRPAV